MTGFIRRGVERFGQPVVIRSAEGEERTVRAFLQPVLERGEDRLGDFTPVGWCDRRLWRYMGLDELNEGDSLLWQSFVVRVRSCQGVFFQNGLCYWHASLEREKEAGT